MTVEQLAQAVKDAAYDAGVTPRQALEKVLDELRINSVSSSSASRWL